jgi:hypothetical protein
MQPMIDNAATTLFAHLALAVLLFFSINWIGKHAVEFGYSSSSLFEDPKESFAFNFFLRALSPSVFIILLSAAAVSLSSPNWRIDIYLVVVYYYLVRFCAILLLNRQRLVSWPKFVIHTAAGMLFAYLTYVYLVLPNKSLLPNFESAGNELWLAIFAFLYAVANKVPQNNGPGAGRRNAYIRERYQFIRSNFASIIDNATDDRRLLLTIYGIIVYEDYSRPPAVRLVERLIFWKSVRTTGIMQVSAAEALTDERSVELGSARLYQAWEVSAGGETWRRVRETISSYNADDDYVGKVFEIMEIISKRIDPSFRSTYNEIWDDPVG